MKNASDVSDRSRLFRLLMIGDVVGKPGKSILTEHLPRIREERQVDFVVINAENAKDGSGITPEIYNTLIECGVDCITLGDHAFRSKSIYPMLNDPTSRLVRPANFPAEAPGRGYALIESVGANGRPATLVGVTSLLGRVFMQNPIDNPFSVADKMLVRISEARVKILDFHAEATSEAQAMGRYLDGKFTAVLGTHTHVATADECILPGGTAYQTDVGMTGPFHSIIGRNVEPVLDYFKTGRQTLFDVAKRDVRINGVFVDVNLGTGKAVAIDRFDFRV